MTARIDLGGSALDDATTFVRERIEEASQLLGAFDVPRFDMGGSLLRPLTAYALGGSAAESSAAPRFWCAALAVQLAHEASLLHDDVIDGAVRRRGVATVAASRGPAEALLVGDHALTASYRAAAMSADMTFISMFARAVERTVAGEREQASSNGTKMDLFRYRQIVLGKSGELFGCAAAIGPLLLGDRGAPRRFELGRRLGLVYQMLDDLLDYCPRTDTGKPALGDYRQGRWTWPLSVLDSVADVQPGRDPSEIVDLLFSRAPGMSDSPARRALGVLDAEIEDVVSELRTASADTLLPTLLEQWRAMARDAIRDEERRHRPQVMVSTGDGAVTAAPTLADVGSFMSRHSRSFRFATLLLPTGERPAVERVYAWCRYTDDLVDEVDAGDAGAVRAAEAGLGEWLERSRNAYRGVASGVGLIDETMRDMARRGIPFAYAALLVDGVRMDLRSREYATMPELSRYTYRVASVVGLWLCGLYEVDDPWMQERASALGHAMQLTNILRDVGEDLDRGRLYLPLDLMRRHGLDRDHLAAMRAGDRPIGPFYRAMIDEMIGVADASYRFASEAFPHLPPAFGRSVAVAAAVYADIHRRIRATGYDTLRRRAYTSSIGKMAVGARALLTLRVPRVVVRQPRSAGPRLAFAPDRHALG